MCNCNCIPCCPGQPTEPPAGGGGGGTQPPARCTRYRLSINSINVTAIDDGFLGGNLEATFTFVVNGQARTWINNDLGTGTHNIGLTFFVDVPADTSTITLEVSGIEDDPFFDDILAGFTAVYGQAQNWGVGAQTGAASDSNITYTLNYEITCAQDIAVQLSRAALLSYGQHKASKRKKSSGGSPAILLSWGLDRLRREGWQVMHATADEYVLKGAGLLPSLIEKKFGEGSSKK